MSYQVSADITVNNRLMESVLTDITVNNQLLVSVSSEIIVNNWLPVSVSAEITQNNRLSVLSDITLNNCYRHQYRQISLRKIGYRYQY